MLIRTSIFAAILAGALAGCQGQGPASDAKEVAGKAASGHEATSLQAMSENDFRKGMALDEVKVVEYRGEDGQHLDYVEFIARVQAGRSFNKVVELDKSRAVVSINASTEEHREPAGSQPLNFPISAALPQIEDRDLDGHLHELANGKRHTLLSFFFTDCVPCIQEIPAINSLSGEYDGLNVVSVTFEDKDMASKFTAKRGLKVPVIPGAQRYIDALGVRVYPTLVLVSPEGRLMGVRSSYTVSESQDAGLAELKSWLDSLGLKT